MTAPASRCHLWPQDPKTPWSHAVLATLSSSYPPPGGRLPTRYSPVRRSTQGVAPPFALDLHVLSTPPAFVLSQDQTLHLIWKRQDPYAPLHSLFSFQRSGDSPFRETLKADLPIYERAKKLSRDNSLSPTPFYACGAPGERSLRTIRGHRNIAERTFRCKKKNGGFHRLSEGDDDELLLPDFQADFSPRVDLPGRVRGLLAVDFQAALLDEPARRRPGGEG